MLADLAMRSDRRVVAFDLFGDLDLRRSAHRVVTRRGLTALVDAAVAEAPGEVVYGASFENHPALVERLGERHALLGNPASTLRAVRDPAQLGAALGDLPHPRTTVATPSSGRWLRKPLRGGGGIRVREWRGGALPAGTFLQERIDGVACSAAAVGDGKDAVVLGVTEQLVGQRAFGVLGHRWCGNLVPPRVPAGELPDQARAICSRLAAAFGLRGWFGVDLIWDGERAWTVEVNPRPTASLEAIAAAYGEDLFDAHLRACAGELPRHGAECRRAAGKAVLFATEDVVIGDSGRWLERGVRDVPDPGERIAAGRPICTVVTTATTPQDALAGLEEQAARLRADLGARVEVAAGG
jgi:predicted ATP-grasp superfamily ATP-dependent carboligase